MNKRAFRCPVPSVVVFGLLLLNVIGAAVADESPQRTPRAREAFWAIAPPPTIGCQSCALAFDKCFATCFAHLGKRTTGACLTACYKAAVTCTCDGAVTLRSEDLVEWGLVSLNKEEACHGPVSCQPNYPSCAGWSPLYACGEPSCVQGSYTCLGCDEESCPEPPTVLAHHSERFRVCFDQFGNSCTEWQGGFSYPTCDQCDW
jgi:hypothetical protein